MSIDRLSQLGIFFCETGARFVIHTLSLMSHGLFEL